ncbi:ATP-binding protein [Vibrio mediterranei]|uniref:ATP-binding protein n=1 Tax=Vibrio mediterranei TaxID=689 RepID=UPI004067A530
MKNLKLKINQENYLKNVRHSFSNSQTIFHEIIQNSIRAKATTIDITVEIDESKRKVTAITIADNGIGVSDPQVLFSIADSDWDSETMRAKRPFGYGFIAALNAGGFIEIESNNFRIAESTNSIFDQETFQAQTLDTVRAGTSVKMSQINEEISRLIFDNSYAPTAILIESKFSNWCRGYSVNINVNGQLVENAWAYDRLKNSADFDSHTFEHGTLFIPKQITQLWQVGYVLQGKNMSHRSNHSIGDEIVIVHLNDDTLAVMPDREQLKNAEIVRDSVRKAFSSFMRNWVRNYLSKHDVETLAKDVIAQQRALNFAPELLNDIELIPHNLGINTDDFSMDLTDLDSGHVHTKLSWLKEEYRHFILVESPIPYDNYQPENNIVVQHMISRPDQFMFVCTTKLDDGHWLKTAVRPLESFKATMKTEGQSESFCVDIDEIIHGAVADNIYTTLEGIEGVGTPSYVTAEGSLYISGYYRHNNAFIRELSTFDRDGFTDMSYLEEKTFEIESLIKRFSAEDVASTVKLTLDDVRFSDTLQLMRNKRFEIEVDENGQVQVTETTAEAA